MPRLFLSHRKAASRSLRNSVTRGIRSTLRLLCAVEVVAPVRSFTAPPDREVSRDALFEDYNQWKEAKGDRPAVPAKFTAPPGFTVELMRPARPDEGSWVSMVFDPRGRIIIGREDRGLLRLRLPDKNGAPERVESMANELLECRGLLFAYGALYVNANNSKGLYRLRDSDGDDQFEEIKLLKETSGGVGHGRNDLAEDGAVYSIHGDDVGIPAAAAPTSPFRGPAPAGLLPCTWEKHLYGSAAPPPQGHLIRVAAEGNTWEVIAGGLRNPYGIAFNEDGEAFTYDADLEWDIGLPWYHPTRVLHLVPGADYGWRRSVSNPASWLPDSRPAVADIGKGSPTAICFGTKSSFPPRWRRALFILDWAYGRIRAVHLTPQGASYTGRSEIFLNGRPLNVTDLAFGPDGAMWFITGGRRTQSALYRVRFAGRAETESGSSAETLLREAAAREARSLRRRLEELTRRENPDALDLAWPHLAHEDDWIRHAARLAIERQPVATWQHRALAETRPRARAAALLALARMGPPEVRERLLAEFLSTPLTSLPVEDKIALLRACEIEFIRHGKPGGAASKELAEHFNAAFPDKDSRVNRQCCELLVFLESPYVVAKTIPLIAMAATQEEALDFLFLLRLAKSGWSTEDRRRYFESLRKAAEFRGAHFLPLVLKYIHADAVSALTNSERTSLGDALAPPEQAPVPVAPPDPNRRFVKAWTISDFDAVLPDIAQQRDLHRGKSVFAEALCQHCHQFGGAGTPNGPDLTGAAGRFPRRDLLEHILDPSKVIAESYRNISVTTTSGVIIDGRFVAEDSESLTLATNPVEPDSRATVRKSNLVSRRDSPISPMPPALLNNFTREEILDLMAWLEFGPGRPEPGK